MVIICGVLPHVSPSVCGFCRVVWELIVHVSRHLVYDAESSFARLVELRFSHLHGKSHISDSEEPYYPCDLPRGYSAVVFAYDHLWFPNSIVHSSRIVSASTSGVVLSVIADLVSLDHISVIWRTSCILSFILLVSISNFSLKVFVVFFIASSFSSRLPNFSLLLVSPSLPVPPFAPSVSSFLSFSPSPFLSSSSRSPTLLVASLSGLLVFRPCN